MMLSELRINYEEEANKECLMEQPENSKSIFSDHRTKRIIIVLGTAVSMFYFVSLAKRPPEQQMAAFKNTVY